MRAVISSKKFIAVFLGAFAFAVLFGVPRVVRVESVECESQFGPCQEMITADLAKFGGKSYADAKTELTNYLKAEASINKYAIRFLLPDKFIVNIVQNKPQFGIEGPHGQIALVSSDGVVLSYEDLTLLPKLRIPYQPPAVGDKIDKQAFFAAGLLAYANRLYSVQEGTVQDGTLRISIGGAHFIYPLEGDAQRLIGATIIITNQVQRPRGTPVLNNADFESRMEVRPDLSVCKSSCTIDLQYKNPVVKI